MKVGRNPKTKLGKTRWLSYYAALYLASSLAVAGMSVPKQTNLPKLPVITKSEASIASNGIQPEEIWLLGSRYGNAAHTMQCTLDGSQKTGNSRNNATTDEQNPNTALLRMAQLADDPRFAELRKQALSMLAAQGKTGDAKTDADITETLQQA